MFCMQNAYTPKSLDAKSLLQRIHTRSGSTSRKFISKQDFLQPLFDCEFSDVHSSRIAQNIERYIKGTRKYQRETQFFVEAVLSRIYFLHKYNLKVAEVTFKYPLTPNLTQLLLRYIVLECSVLYNRGYHTLRYEAIVEERILRVLHSIYNSYLDSLNTIPPEKLYKEQCTAILNLIIKIKSEFEVQNDLMENIAKRLLIKMGKLEQVNALKKKCIPCPLDTYLNDPAVVNSYKNIITSDYGTDDDLKIEEEVIQVDTQNEDNDANQDLDIKQDISELLCVSNRMCQNSTNNTVKKVPTIYIDDEIEEIVLLEEEVRTSSKSARRQKAEEEKKIMLREKQYEMLSNHKPLDNDMKPYIKNEVIDLNSEDESSISKKHSHNSDINKTIRDQVFVDEVVIIDDDVSEVSVQPSAVSNLVVIKEFNKEDVLELSSDEDESFNVIPKEEEEKLLGDDAMDETNYSLVSTDISTITCRAAISVVDEPVHKINTNTSSTNITKTVHLDISTVKCFDSAIPLNKSNVSCLSAEDTLDSSSHGVDNLETLNSPQFKNNGSTEKPIFKAISEKVECEINSNQETLQSNEMLTSKLNMKDQEKMEELFNRDGTEKTNDMQMLEKCIDKHNEKLKDSGEKNLMEDMKVTKQITMEDNSSNDDKYCEAKTKENADVNIKHVELENAEVQIDENSGQQNKTDDHIGDFQVAENATSTFVETKTTKELCDHAKNELLELTQQESDKLCPVEQLIEEPTENNSINEVKNLIIHKERSMDDEKDILIEETSPGLSSGGNIETHLENNELSNIEATDVNIKYSEPLKQKEISGKNAETHLENNESGKIEVIDVKVKNTKPSEQKEKDEGSIITHLENNELSKIEAINADVTKSEPIKQKEKKATETSLENNEPNEIEANNVKIKNSKLSEQKEKGEEDIETHLEKKEQSKIENSKVLEQEEKDVNIIEEIAIAAAERNPENNITLEVSKTKHLLVNEEYTDNHSYQNDKASNPLKIEDSEALFENIDVETISDASNINNVKTVVADEKNETMKIHDKNLTADEIPSSHNNYSFDVEPNQSLVSKEINLSEKYDSENFNSGQFGENGDVTSQLSENKDILDTVIERSDHVNSGLNEEDLSQNKNKEKGNFEIINGASITSNGIKDNEISIQKIITSNEISNVEQSYKNATAGEDKYETLSSFVEEIEEEIIIRKNNVDSNEKSNKEESHVEHDIRNVNASCRQVSLKVTNDLSVSESNILSSDEIEESVAQEENYTHQNDQDNDLSKDDKPRITLYSKVNNNSQEKSLEVCDINDIKSQIDDFNSNNVNETDSFLEDPKEIELIKKQIDDERIECTMDFKEDKTDCDHTIATISQGEEASVDILNLTKTNPQLLTENVDICINSNSENQNTKSIEIQNNLLPNQEFFNQSSETVTEVIEIAGINYPEAETKNFKEYIEEIEEKTSEKRSSIYNDTEKLLDESKTGKESLLIITENHITVSEKDKNLPEEQGIVKEHNNDARNNVNSNELLQIINQEAEELNRVEQLTEEPAGHFLEDNNTNDIEEIADKCTEDIGKNSLVEDTLLSSDLHTGEEETQEIYQFQNTEHEIEITTEGVEQFKLLEQKEFNKDYYVDIVTEETDVNEEVMKEGNTIDDQLEEHDVHSFIQENTYENINTNHFQVVKNTDPSVTEEIYYEKYIPGSSKESNLINNLNVQKEEIITEVDTLHLGISEEFIVSEDIPQSCEETTDKSASDNEYTLRNQLIPVTIQMGMKIEKIEIGNIVTNDQLIPQHLEICDIPNIPDENTSLDILATVASEVSRQDLLVGKKKKRTVHHERRKKQSYLKNKIKGVQERHTTKKKSNGALVVSHNIENKRVTRSAQIKKQTEIYHEPKCKPHDFVITDNSGVPPPANNIYTQKLPDVHLTSEDSNDSEGILLIDEDIDMKLSKSTKEILNSLGTKKFTYYDEETIEENITFCYEPKVKGTVLISIPDTFQGNFEFLTQIEQLDACSSHSTNKEDNMQSLQNDIVSSATDINSKTHFNDVLSPINDKNITETEPLDNKSDVGNTQIMEQAILEKNHKPFRTKAEQKDYDKFSLKPYVSIKRLYIISKNEEKTKHARSKSVDMGIVRNLCDEQLDSDTLNNKSENLPPTESENKASHEQTSKLISEQKVDRLPTEIKLKNNVIDETYDVEGNQDSDDDVPLLQRTQLESKQTKKSVTGPKCTSESKKEKSSRRGDFNKGIKGKADSKTKIKSKKSHINIKKEDGELSKNIISAEETVSTDEYKDTKVKHSTKKINTKTKLVEKQPKNNDSEIEVLKQNIKVEENIDTKIKDSIKSKEINEVSTDLFKSKEQCVHVSKQDKESKKSTTPCEKSNNQEKSDAENVTSVNASNYISLSAAHSNMQTSKDSIVSVWKGSVSSSMVEEDICPTNVLESENISKEKDNICIPQNNAQLVREAPTYEEYMKTSNTKYYTTPKLRRKSVSKHNLNRNEKNSDIKYEEAMQFIFSADKKYYTPPKLRRKSVVENEITSDSATVINKATPKQIKLSTSKVNILSKCKNTISPTTEKLKKKLETDFKLNCTELSTPEHTLNDTQINSHELEKDDLISNSENLGSNSTNNISPKSSKNALLLISEDEVPDIKCVNTDVSINDIKEQNVYVEATDIIIKSENNQDGNVLITDNKLEGPCVFGKIIDIALSPALEEELQQPQICNTSTAVDISKLQNKTSSEIQNDTSLQPPINKNEDTVPDGVIEDDENLDNLPLSERSSVSCQNQLTTSEIKIEMKPHKKGTKGIISNTESSSTVENKEKCDKDNQPENIVLNCDMQNKSVEDLVKIDSGNIKPQHKIKNKKSKTKPAEELRGIHENTTILKQENIQKEGNRKRNQSTKLKEKANKERYNKQKKYDKFSRNQKLSRKSMDTLTVDEYKNVKHDKKKRSSKAKPTEGLTKNNDIETETLNQNTGNEEQLKTKTKVKEVSKTSTELFQNREQYMSDPNLNSLNKKRTDSALQLEVSSKKEKKKSRKHEKLGPDYDTEENISEIKDTKNKSSKNDPQLEPKNFKTDIELQVQLCDMNRFKDKKSDGNSERVSSELSFVALPKNDMNNDHHSSKKEKDSDSQSKKSLNSKTEVEIFAKSNRVDDVLTASDVSKTSDVSIKATDFSSSCTRKNKIYEESNKKNKDKKDKRRANQKSEQSETIEKKKQEKNTKCSKTLEFEVNEDKNIDLTETNKSNTDVIATKKCTDNFHQVQAFLTTSIEIKDSGGSEETNVEQAKQDVNKCMQEGEEKKIANDSHDILFKIPQDIKNSSNANEKVPLTQQESDISQVDELVELSLDTAHSNVNEKVPLTQQESDISQIDEPVEASLDTAHSSDINEKDSLTLQVSDTNSQLIILDTKNVCISNEKIALNHELNGNSHTNICKDTRSNSKNKENKYENVRMENSMAQQLGNYTVTIPLEKVSEIEINWKNKTYNKKDHNNSSVKMKMENNSKHDNNSESIVADIHTDTTDHISEEKKNNILNIVEKETESEEKPKIIKSSEEEYILDQNLKLESKQNSEQMKEDNNNVFNSISEKSNDTNKVLTQSVASQDNMLEATPTVNEQKEEVIQKNISELLVEISIETKENKSTDIAEVENKNSEEQHEDAQNSQEFIEHEIHESKKQLNTKDNFDKIKSVKLEGEYVSKSENNISDTIAQADADTKRKRKNSTFEENICSEKKSKLSEINIDVSPFSEIQDANNKSPELLSPLSTNRKKDKKTIECIISQLKEEKVNSMEASDELSKSQLTSSPITVDVSTLRKKLLQKIKGHSLLKNCQSAGEGANIVSTDDKSSQLEILPLNSEIAQTNTIQVKIPSRSETTKLNDEDIIKKKLLTDVYSPIITPPETASEMECNIIEEEISSEEIFQKKSDIGEVDSVHNCENPQNLKEAESMLAQNVATYTYDDFIDSSDKNITNNIETPVLKLKEEEITEGYANSESLSAADNILENMEKENNNSSKNSSHNVESSMSKSEEEEITDGHGNSESLSATDKILENVEKENNNSKDITNNLESSMSKLKEEEITEDGNHGNSESLSAADKILENMEKGNNSSKNITNNVKDSMSKLEEEEITEDHGNSESLPAANKIVENMEKKNNNGSNNLSITDIELEKTAVFLCETSITTEVSDNSSNKNESTFDIESATDEIRCGIKENPETIILSPVIECETISPTPEIISESILLPDAKVQKLDENAIMVSISNDAAALSTPLVGDSSENAEEETDDSFSQSKESFSDTCLENSSKKTMTGSANPCEFDTANVETNLLNLCDLMLHVDTVGNVTRNMEESVSSETVCILSDIISTPISSTDSKLSCVSSTGAIKLFTFPVTSQTEIKEQFIPMNEVNTNKSIFDESPTAAEKLPSNKNRDCLFSLNEQIDNSANPQTLTFPSISLNLQDVHFTKIPIDSTQMFDLISPIQTSTTSNFMNEIPVDNEINDMSEARGSNVIDHNYTLEPLGGPLLSGRPEEEQIFPATFDKNLVDSPGEFPLNDNQLPSELSESDDTYKLNLDNEYAVKNLVKLGSQTSDANTFPLSNYNLSDIKRMNLIEDSISNSEENSNSLDTLSLVTSMGQESKDITNNTNPWAQFKNEENRNQNIIVSPNEQCFTSAFSISQNDLIQSTTLTNSNFEGSFLKVSHNSEIQIKSNKLGNSSMEEELKDIPNVLNPWAQFIANENLNQKVVVLPNEQYFTPSFSLSQNDFIQTTTLPASSIDGDIILLKESPELHIKNEPTKSDTSLIASIKQESKCIANDEKSIDLDKKNESVKPDTSKYNIKRNKRPKKITQKDSIDNDDFLPKRTYSRTVLRAPFKKNPTNSADHKKIMHQNKVMQPLEAGLDVKPSSTLPIIEKSLPDVNSLLNTETVQKDLKQNSKEIPTDLPPKKLQLELPRCENKSKSPIQNPSETPNPSGSIVEKPSAAVKESKKSEVEVKNFSLETLSKASPNTTLKTKEIVSNSIKVSDNMPVYCSSADLVKLRKRAVTNRYSSNYISPSPAKELKSEMAKSKKTLQKSSLGRSRANTPEVKTNVESLQERKNHREQKSLTDNLLEKCLKSGTPKLQLLHENKVLHTETKTNVRVCRLGDASSIDNKSNLQSSTAPLEGSSRKYNYSIDSILRKEPKPNSIHLNENSIKDCRQSKGQGLKRSLPTTTDDNESQKKQMKIAFLEPRQSSTMAKNNEKLKKPTKGSLQSENNSDKTFDSLLQQGNVNELIHLRVTEDNKLKTERKCNLSLKQNGNEMEFKLKMERGSSRSRDQIDVVKKEAERRNSPLMKSHSRDKDDEFDKLGSARSSQLMKVSSRNKEQSEHNKHVRSSFHSSYSRPRETSSTRSREDVRSDCNKTYSSLRSHKAREQHYSDYSRKRKAYYSDHIRGREAHHSGYSGTREGHHSDHSRLKEQYVEHSGVRSSNVSASYYKNYPHNLSTPQLEEQSTHSGQRHSSGPYMKRGTTLSQEKQNELLNALRDLVHKQLNSSGLKKSSAEEDFEWIEKLNQFNETPQFLPHGSSPPSDDK